MRLVIMGALGWACLVRQLQWARLAFAGLEYLSSLAGLVLAFVSLRGEFRFQPAGVMICAVYLLLGVAASVRHTGVPTAGHNEL